MTFLKEQILTVQKVNQEDESDRRKIYEESMDDECYL
jgi:hypothetical protein